ncbi:MAG: 4Fe-4S dicluster domain-containing protein [Candidatus Alcyoniella australis]|nr:4Fe-4S dicluster domain-containing protein [Candidatus Alcyoniella australis]
MDEIQTKTPPQTADELVPIFIMGKRYMVPGSLTIQKAFEYAGYKLVRGCGCRGGICGACGTLWRVPGSYRVEIGLACQTIVQPDMYIAQIPFFPANRAQYDVTKLEPTAQTLSALYPELQRCMGCNTCTKSCPMEIEVMEYISAALRGDILKCAELSFDCVMCGLCTARCPAELAQYHIAELARRLAGVHLIPRAEHLTEVCETIEQGGHQDKLEQLKAMDESTMRRTYTARTIEPMETEDDWTPPAGEQF